MNASQSEDISYQSRTRKSLIQLFFWGLAWLAATALLKIGPRLLWNRALFLTLLAGALNLCVGLGLILAEKRYIAQLDELQQKIYLNAFAITIGVAVVLGIPISVLHMYNILPFQPDIANMLGIMSLTFCASVFYGSVRYR